MRFAGLALFVLLLGACGSPSSPGAGGVARVAAVDAPAASSTPVTPAATPEPATPDPATAAPTPPPTPAAAASEPPAPAAPPAPLPAQIPAARLPAAQEVGFSGLAPGLYPVHLHTICSGAQGYHLAYLPSLSVGANRGGSVAVPAGDFGRGWCLIVYANAAQTAVLAVRRI